ncbi:hypothetical protein OfM1_18960 [Lactovum odontotermitis]
MADNIDHMIRDYLTGKLEQKIKIRELSLAARVPSENIGGSRTPRSNESEQARLLEKMDSDPLLNKWKHELEQVPEWLKTVDNLTHDIIILRFKYDKTWWQVRNETGLRERAAQNRYADFKQTILRWTE